MQLKLSLYLAKRYLTAKWSLMSTLSILMICFGVVTLITVLSIMNGFHNTYLRKILETNTYHVIIQPRFDGLDYERIKSILAKNNDIVSVVPYFDGEAILKSKFITRGIVVKAFPNDLLARDSGFRSEIKVTHGVFDLGNDSSIVLGEELARETGVDVGDYISLLTFVGEDLSLARPTLKIFKVVGFFKTGYWEYDKNMAYISLQASYKLFGINERDLTIGVKIENISKAERMVTWLYNNGLDGHFIYTWMDINRPLFEALQNEKVGIGFVVMLIIVSGAFNIIGSLVMTVMDKKREIGILRAIGATPSLITKIFIFDGLYIGLWGTSLGVFIGFLLTLNIEQIFTFFEAVVNTLRNIAYFLFLMPLNIPLPPSFEILSDSIYYLEGVPVEIHFWDVFIISVLAVFISVCAAYYPAKKASLMKPVDTIRYE